MSRLFAGDGISSIPSSYRFEEGKQILQEF